MLPPHHKNNNCMVKQSRGSYGKANSTCITEAFRSWNPPPTTPLSESSSLPQLQSTLWVQEWSLYDQRVDQFASIDFKLKSTV